MVCCRHRASGRGYPCRSWLSARTFDRLFESFRLLVGALTFSVGLLPFLSGIRFSAALSVDQSALGRSWPPRLPRNGTPHRPHHPSPCSPCLRGSVLSCSVLQTECDTVSICTIYGSPRTGGGVVHSPGITVIGTPGACASTVMPGVRSTPGQPQPGDVPGDIRGVVPRVRRVPGGTRRGLAG